MDGELIEVSRNFFNICSPTNDVFYFGEDVDINHEDGSIYTRRSVAAGFRDSVRVRETSPLDGVGVSIKTYCPNVGLVNDGDLELVRYSPRDRDDDD